MGSSGGACLGRGRCESGVRWWGTDAETTPGRARQGVFSTSQGFGAVMMVPRGLGDGVTFRASLICNWTCCTVIADIVFCLFFTPKNGCQVDGPLQPVAMIKLKHTQVMIEARKNSNLHSNLHLLERGPQGVAISLREDVKCVLGNPDFVLRQDIGMFRGNPK